ncbi:MAG TPA: GNAT family N-acetyltransferase [Chthoniobacteraceae bacterium]|nr:GNAT family N-acetyltransferase [Chthoniobacteraceae bacterium]
MNPTIRPFQPSDLEVLKRITAEAFGGASIDQLLEQHFGILHGHDWRWRKMRHIDDDAAANPGGIFVAESGGEIMGYITTTVDRAAGKGRIANIALVPEARGQGLGRRLIQHALDYFRREGLAYAMIETLEGNEIGEHLYPTCGFVEVARQIHFALKL